MLKQIKTAALDGLPNWSSYNQPNTAYANEKQEHTRSAPIFTLRS